MQAPCLRHPAFGPARLEQWNTRPAAFFRRSPGPAKLVHWPHATPSLIRLNSVRVKAWEQPNGVQDEIQFRKSMAQGSVFCKCCPVHVCFAQHRNKHATQMTASHAQCQHHRSPLPRSLLPLADAPSARDTLPQAPSRHLPKQNLESPHAAPALLHGYLTRICDIPAHGHTEHAATSLPPPVPR